MLGMTLSCTSEIQQLTVVNSLKTPYVVHWSKVLYAMDMNYDTIANSMGVITHEPIRE